VGQNKRNYTQVFEICNSKELQMKTEGFGDIELRDFFAGMAIAGCMAKPDPNYDEFTEEDSRDQKGKLSRIALEAYMVADEMMERRLEAQKAIEKALDLAIKKGNERREAWKKREGLIPAWML